MKNIKYLLFAILTGFAMMTNVYAKESIEIKSITLDTKSENTVINSEPTFSGLEMNYDLTFKQVNDYAKYKIVIENNTNKDYKVTENKSFSISEYVTYKYESSQTLKANQTSTLYVIITYNKEVDSSLLVEGKYKETNKAVLQMTDENNVPAENPKTGVSNALLLLSLVGVLSVCIVVMINRQQKSLTLIVLLALCLVPMITKAIEELKLTINVNVEIQKVEETPVTPTAQKYEVRYLINNSEIWIKNDELDNYDLTLATCEIKYIGTVDDDHKYTVCSNLVVYKDPTTYAAGETVPLNTVNTALFMCVMDRNAEYTVCEETSNEITVPYNSWSYSSNVMTEYGYTPLENDKEVMNFNIYAYDYWNDYKFFLVNSPNTFTMPEHNVLFVYQQPLQ